MNKKLYPCKQCGKEVPIRSKGLCTYCRYIQKGSPVKRYILKQTDKNRLKKKEKSELMKPYWEYHLMRMNKINAKCENCGCEIRKNVCNVAHIIPKSVDFNVANNLNNCIYLCAMINGGNEIGCHDKLDKIQTTYKVYLMPCWKKCVEKYLTFKHECRYNRYVANFENYIEENNEL